MLKVYSWFLLFSILTVSFRHLDIVLLYWRIFLEMKTEDIWIFLEKKEHFFNSGLCCLFSEKRYICFLVYTLAALLTILIPDLVRKYQIMCSRIWAEEIVFLKFLALHPKLLLVAIETTDKENFPQSKLKYFLYRCY